MREIDHEVEMAASLLRVHSPSLQPTKGDRSCAR